MKTKMTWRKTALAALVVGLFAEVAHAGVGTPSFLDIDVNITQTLSVAVNGVASSTVTVSYPNGGGAVVQTSTANVKNDTGGLTEKWALSTNANSIDTGGAGVAGSWALQSAVNSSSTLTTNQFTVQAVFGSSKTIALGCPAVAASEYGNGTVAPFLTAGQTNYTAAVLADPNLNNNGTPNPDGTPNVGDITNNGQRALCFQVVTPPSTTATPSPKRNAARS